MKLKDENIAKVIIKYINSQYKIKKYFDFSYKSQKHHLIDQLKEIIKIIKYALPWRIINNISWNTVYSTYKRLLYFDVIKNTYIELLRKYFKKAPNNKLKIQITDTTCIRNRYGSSMVNYNGYKKMKCTKVSFITDRYGIPINVYVSNGNKCDSKILLNQLNCKFLIDNELHNRYKHIILADSMYDSNEVIKELIKLNYKPIIAINKRNTKFTAIRKLTKEEIKIYKQRLHIEHINNTFKTNRRCICRYDRIINTFYGSIYFSLIDTILNVL